jgi:hypothetical protein
MPLLAALDKLTQAIADHGAQAPQPLPATLDRKQIATMVSVFQTKEREGRWAEDEAHVKNLKGIVGNPDSPRYLDPITVWWGGDRWYVIDGHRRLAAYRKAGVSSGIPVVVFQGSLDDARAHSVALNSKDQMPMTTADKMNCAWRLALTTGLSRSRLTVACSVSKGSIDNIRSVKTKLLERGMAIEDLADMPWEAARREAEGREAISEFDPDEALKKRAEIIRRRLMKALGDRIVQDLDAFAMAVMSIDSRLPGRLMQSDAWWVPFRRAVEDLAEELGEDAQTILNGLPEDAPDDDDDEY